MAYYPYGPTFNDIYWLVSPSGGVTARFNGLTSDANWSGVITEAAGLDSPEVRESSEDLVQSDGGVHGNFWFGRRPIVLTGKTYGYTTVAARNAMLDRITRASTALRGDAELHWLPSDGGPEMMTWVRRQQPVKYSGGWAKDFQIPLVSQYARLYGATLNQPTQAFNTNLVIENRGSYPSVPIVRITGPITNPVVTNSTNGLVIKFLAGVALTAGQYVDVDVGSHRATRDNGTDWTGNLDFLLTTWPTVDTGNNTFILTGTGNTGATQLRVSYRHTWV
jgi:hypothetical protein